MKKVIYKCDFCSFETEFLDQEVWEVILPMGYAMSDEGNPKRLLHYRQHVCLKHGLEIYDAIMKIKNIEAE